MAASLLFSLARLNIDTYLRSNRLAGNESHVTSRVGMLSLTSLGKVVCLLFRSLNLCSLFRLFILSSG